MLCPVLWCGKTAEPELALMCARHWAMVPAELQTKVIAAHRHRKGRGVRRWVNIRQEAIDKVDRMEWPV